MLRGSDGCSLALRSANQSAPVDPRDVRFPDLVALKLPVQVLHAKKARRRLVVVVAGSLAADHPRIIRGLMCIGKRLYPSPGNAKNELATHLVRHQRAYFVRCLLELSVCLAEHRPR